MGLAQERREKARGKRLETTRARVRVGRALQVGGQKGAIPRKTQTDENSDIRRERRATEKLPCEKLRKKNNKEETTMKVNSSSSSNVSSSK